VAIYEAKGAATEAQGTRDVVGKNDSATPTDDPHSAFPEGTAILHRCHSPVGRANFYCGIKLALFGPALLQSGAPADD
jgi:hypothetical protein